MDLISNYYTDLIDIISISKDEWGVITRTTQSNVNCRFEQKNELVKNANGEEVYSNGFLLIDRTATIDNTSKIKLISINDVDLVRKNKEYAILKGPMKAHGFEFSHYEVWI